MCADKNEFSWNFALLNESFKFDEVETNINFHIGLFLDAFGLLKKCLTLEYSHPYYIGLFGFLVHVFDDFIGLF